MANLNKAKNPRLHTRIEEERLASEALLCQFIRVADVVLNKEAMQVLSGLGIAPDGRWVLYFTGLYLGICTHALSMDALLV